MNRPTDRKPDTGLDVDGGNMGDADDAWLDMLLREASGDGEVADQGFSAALLERLPPRAAALVPDRAGTRDAHGAALPLWFRAVNAIALTLGCAAVGWWLSQVCPGLLDAMLPGAGAHGAGSATSLFEGMFIVLALGGWLCWWSRATLSDLLWSTFSELI